MSTAFRTAKRDHDKFIIRLLPGMRDALKAQAKSHGRSMNSEVLFLIEAGLKANDPAAIAVAPGHGSTNPGKEKEMNSPNATTTLSGTPAPPAGGEAMPRRSTTEYAEAWGKCRRLGKELSQALADTGDTEFGHIMPAGYECAVSFGLQDDSRRLSEFPMQTINRLSGRIALLLGDDPEIQVERVVIDTRGVYTQVKVPGVPEDPLLEVIGAYRNAMAAFNALPEDDDFAKNESRFIAETYGPHQQSLMTTVFPTTSMNGVREAVRFAIHEADHIDPVAKNALLSALAYLEAM